jgi:hypothetical protein
MFCLSLVDNCDIQVMQELIPNVFARFLIQLMQWLIKFDVGQLFC